MRIRYAPLKRHSLIVGSQNRQHYDDDEEVIEYESWDDDAWRKNDEQSTSKDKDVIDTIVDKIHSTGTSFKIEARALLLRRIRRDITARLTLLRQW